MENSLFKNSELGLIPFNWNEYSVEKLIELEYIHKPLDGNHGSIHPKGKDFIDCGIPFIMASDINNGKVNLKHCSFISEKQANSLQKGFSIEGDVLLTHKATLGRTAIVPKISTDFIMLTPQVTYYRIKNNDYLNNKYLKYYFDSPSFQGILENHGSSGSTRAYIGITAQRELPIIIPPLSEQKAIASVLSSLDDKIDLLHQQNQTLEALAETLFRQWFIEEAKEDWEILPLSEIAEVKNGKSFKSSDFTNIDFNSYEVVKMGHIERGGGLKLNPKKDFVSREMDVEKWILNKGDIIMAMTDMKDNVVILGVPAMIDKDDHYVLNQRVARIYLKDNSKLISNYLLYIQLNNKDFIAELQTKANSGVQVNLSTEAIKESEILIPPIELQKEFGHKIIDLYSKIEINREQIQTLTQLRDTLLPKLMSGEVRVQL